MSEARMFSLLYVFSFIIKKKKKKKVNERADGSGLGLTVSGRNITDLRYADDTALLAENSTSMRRISHKVNIAC